MPQTHTLAVEACSEGAHMFASSWLRDCFTRSVSAQSLPARVLKRQR